METFLSRDLCDFETVCFNQDSIDIEVLLPRHRMDICELHCKISRLLLSSKAFILCPTIVFVLFYDKSRQMNVMLSSTDHWRLEQNVHSMYNAFLLAQDPMDGNENPGRLGEKKCDLPFVQRGKWGTCSKVRLSLIVWWKMVMVGAMYLFSFL